MFFLKTQKDYPCRLTQHKGSRVNIVLIISILNELNLLINTGDAQQMKETKFSLSGLYSVSTDHIWKGKKSRSWACKMCGFHIQPDCNFIYVPFRR